MLPRRAAVHTRATFYPELSYRPGPGRGAFSSQPYPLDYIGLMLLAVATQVHPAGGRRACADDRGAHRDVRYVVHA